MSGCPSADQLRQLLGEGLPESDRAVIAEHARTCAACCRTLAGLQDDTEAIRWPRLVPPTEADHDREAQQHPPPPSAVPGRPHIPGYEILNELGHGGMGVVYRARQLALKRIVALKVLRAGPHASAAERARFRLEAEAVARLRHPQIVEIHELGEHDGQPFFALEYVEGGTLAQQLAGQPQPPHQVAELVESLARAVACAHQVGIVHRDLKPGNVLMAHSPCSRDAQRSASDPLRSASRLPDALVPKVADFGLAKHVEGPDKLTSSGAVLGTPAYMAPEQASGVTRNLTPAADVWSLGAILYECLTGRPPFLDASPAQTVVCVLSDDPLPPRRLVPQVPRDLEAICLKCLEKDPKRRYPTALELAEDLQRFRAGRPTRARPLPAWRRAWKWARRRPAWAWTAAGAVLLVAALAGAWWGQRPAGSPGPAQPRLQVYVWRGQRSLRLLDAVPLHTGDKVDVVVRVAPGRQPALFWFDTEARLHALPLERRPSDEGAFRYPGQKEVVPLTGPPGTELLLLCARHAPPVALEEVQGLFGARPWPELPGAALLRLDAGEVRLLGARGPGRITARAENGVLARAEALREELARRFDFVGVAFSHRD
jgi:hypothetical protein